MYFFELVMLLIKMFILDISALNVYDTNIKDKVYVTQRR